MVVVGVLEKPVLCEVLWWEVRWLQLCCSWHVASSFYLHRRTTEDSLGAAFLCGVEAEEGICSPGLSRSVPGCLRGCWCFPSLVPGSQPGTVLAAVRRTWGGGSKGCCFPGAAG